MGRVLCRIPGWVDRIYVVDDASRDGTAQAAQATADPRLVVIRHPRNQGVGSSIVTGYRQALHDDCEILVVMAGDDQMDPEDLPELVTAVATGECDYAKGNRFLHPERKRMPWTRRVGGALLSLATRWATGLRVDDTQCGYTALSAPVGRALPLSELWPRFGYPNDLLGMLASRGYKVRDVVVRPVYGDERSGIRPWHLLQILYLILRRQQLERHRSHQASSVAATTAAQ